MQLDPTPGLAAFPRTITELDHARLLTLVRRTPDPLRVDDIDQALDLAELVPSREVAPDVVTMGSQVLLQDEGDDALPARLTLCYPPDADAATGHVSVLSPVGTALLGLQAGAVACWRTPHGDEARARVLEVVFQPEASGDYLA